MREYPLDIQIIKSAIPSRRQIRPGDAGQWHLAILQAQALSDWLAEREKTDNFPWSQGHKPNF